MRATRQQVAALVLLFAATPAALQVLAQAWPPQYAPNPAPAPYAQPNVTVGYANPYGNVQYSPAEAPVLLGPSSAPLARPRHQSSLSSFLGELPVEQAQHVAVQSELGEAVAHEKRGVLGTLRRFLRAPTLAQSLVLALGFVVSFFAIGILAKVGKLILSVYFAFKVLEYFMNNTPPE